LNAVYKACALTTRQRFWVRVSLRNAAQPHATLQKRVRRIRSLEDQRQQAGMLLASWRTAVDSCGKETTVMPTRTAQSIALNTRKRPKEFLSEFIETIAD
jgi:hypothetical protein